MKDPARRISDINHMSAYKSQSILTSKSASIDAKAPEIHHRTISHASNQKSIDTNKLVQENRIFDSYFLWKMAMIRGIHKRANGRIRTYNSDSE